MCVKAKSRRPNNGRRNTTRRDTPLAQPGTGPGHQLQEGSFGAHKQGKGEDYTRATRQPTMYSRTQGVTPAKHHQAHQSTTPLAYNRTGSCAPRDTGPQGTAMSTTPRHDRVTPHIRGGPTNSTACATCGGANTRGPSHLPSSEQTSSDGEGPYNRKRRGPHRHRAYKSAHTGETAQAASI